METSLSQPEHDEFLEVCAGNEDESSIGFEFCK